MEGINNDQLLTSSIVEKDGGDGISQPPKTLSKLARVAHPPGKVALRPSSGPTTEALNRIASAVNKARRGYEENDELMRHGSDDGAGSDERQMNGRYLEIPHLLDGFRMV